MSHPPKPRRAWLHQGILATGFGLLICFCTFTDIDLRLSGRFYTPSQGWYLARTAPWSWLYNYGEYPAIVMSVGAFAVLLGSLWRTAWALYRRQCLFLVLAVALGPGLLVNGVLKPAWGRPRPRHIEPFGGAATYRAWWQPGGPGKGASFPSGHAAMGFALIAAVTLVPCRRVGLRCLLFIVVLGYSGLLGVARIVQGGHFLSDVVGSGGIVGLVIYGLRAALQRAPPRHPEVIR
jgi:membrane-associated PAP2 superfamily phosphatase